MRLAVVTPSFFSISSAIKSAIVQKSLLLGESFHGHLVKTGLSYDTLLCNHLLNLYAQCRRVDYTQKLFDEMCYRNLISYSILISNTSLSGNSKLALRYFSHLHRMAIRPNQFVFSSSIVACSKLQSLTLGEQVHAQVLVSGFGSDPFVNAALVDMYSKNGYLESAFAVFQCCSVKDAVMINSMVSSYVSFGACEEAVELFVEAIRVFDFKPTDFSFSSLIKACSEMEIKVGEQLHGFIMKTGLDSSCFVGTSLLDMYGSFGDMESMEMVFSSILNEDIVLHNAVIGGYTKNGFNMIAIEHFIELISAGFRPNDCTLSAVLKSCGGLGSVNLGSMIHGVVEKSRFQQDLVVNTALIDMYMKFGMVMESCEVFKHMHKRNTISYNAMISGLGHNGNSNEAIRLYADMKYQKLNVDLATYVALVSSCYGHEWGTFVHIIKHGFELDMMVNNAFLDSLLKAGATKDALEFFDKMKERTVISWTTIISGFTHLGLHLDSMELFKAMCSTEICPNSFTFSSVLKSCGNLLYLGLGRCIHGATLKYGAMDEFTDSSLLDMYAKCGALEDTRRLFDQLANKDRVSWNTMITGYARHGYGHEALEIYAQMESCHIDPNHVTFVSLLSACSHCGLVEIGAQLFDQMVSKHRIAPRMEHYACMVDLFGRAGLLDRAKSFISNMPFEADASVWTVFLAACKLHGNLDFAQSTREHLMGLQGEESPTIVLLSNMYSESEKWGDAQNARRKINRDLRKEPGLSWIEGVA
ncbi:pentatricopeptide repeat-containing protein At4g13650-like [Typha latifolia]|uniref:pentatricopeptide repeat-containing protein At4g13650-like n=1 Tax=Typha latifolia TaxID=4733 RepID=UPI003C2BD5E4